MVDEIERGSSIMQSMGQGTIKHMRRETAGEHDVPVDFISI